MLIVLNSIPGGVLKKWRILEGGWMRFLEAISGLMKRLFLLPMKSCSRTKVQLNIWCFEFNLNETKTIIVIESLPWKLLDPSGSW